MYMSGESRCDCSRYTYSSAYAVGGVFIIY